jgi:3,4-dihydroxy 2-butanone 4-phosphate synthase
LGSQFRSIYLHFSALILVNFNVTTKEITMNQSILSAFGATGEERVINALNAFKQGNGVLVLDDEDRENEGDLIFPAETITPEQMAKLIRYGSGIVCLCITDEQCKQLDLPPMVEHNNSVNKTAFTVTIEAAEGVSTGVSAQDRVTTIKAAIADHAKPTDLHRPGHVFPLRAAEGGVLARRGHTEASVDLARLSGFKPAGVICEITNDDGSMARAAEIIEFAKKFGYSVLTIEDLVAYRQKHQC